MHDRGPGPVPLATGSVGGLLLLAAAFLPWSGQGAGSTIALRRIGDLVLAGTVDAWVPRWAGAVVYCVPLGGAVLLIGTGLGRRAGAAVAATGVVLAAAGTVVCLSALGRLAATGVGGGTVAALAGAMLGTVGVGTTWLGQRSTADRSDSPPR